MFTYFSGRKFQDTSGALLLAKTATAARTLSQQFQKGSIGKIYTAIVDSSGAKDRLALDGLQSEPTRIQCHIDYTPTGPQICMDETFSELKSW